MKNAAKQIGHAGLTMMTLALAAMAQGPGESVQKFAIRTQTGFYLTAENSGGLRSPHAVHTDRRQIGAWEIFTVAPTGDGRVTLRTAAGTYVTAEDGGVGGLSTDRTQLGEWEKFRLQPVNGGYALVTVAGTLITAEQNGGLSGAAAVNTNRTAVGPWETFQLIPQSEVVIRRPMTTQVSETPMAGAIIDDRGYTFTFSHGGGYVARFTLYYTYRGERKKFSTGDMTLGQSREFHVPSAAHDIKASGMYYEFFGAAHPVWFDVSPAPGGCIKTWGTVFSPQWGYCN